MKYLKSFESYDTGIISVNINDDILIFNLKVDDSKKNLRVYLIMDGETYSELSIIIPDSEKLGKYDFFLNPSVNKKIVKELENQNFITKIGTVGDAAGQKVMSYSLGI